MKKRKTKKFLMRKVVVLLLFLILFMMGKNLIYHFSSQSKQKQIRLLYNNEFIQLMHALYVQDDVVYISEEDVQEIFDDTIYYNMGDQELITTYNKHVAVLHLGKQQMLVNDSDLEMQGKLQEIDSEIYLPLTDLQIVYDVEIGYSPTTNIVIMDSTTKEKTRAMVLKKTKVKSSTKLFAITVEKINKGAYVTVLEDGGRYQKIKTENGNIGYVKTKKLFNQEKIREDWVQETYEKSDFENTNEVFVINEESTQVSKVSTQLATYKQRNEVINRIYFNVIQNGYHTVCIDFHNIDEINSFYRFVIELTPKFRESGVKVGLKLSGQMDQERVEKMVDLVLERNEN